MNYKFLSTITTLLIVVLVLSSCDDARLAKEIDGSWKYGVTTTDADSTKGEETVILSFTQVESDEKNGGTFTEQRIGKSMAEEDGLQITVRYTVTIDGEYEILVGDLYPKYYMSSLNVSIDDLKSELTADASLQDWSDTFQSIGDFSFVNDYAVMKREAKKSLYHDSFVEYQKMNNDDESCYRDVKIENGKLSFEISDMDRVTLTRIKQL